MSSQVRRYRKERSRYTPHTSQQVWVPKGTSSNENPSTISGRPDASTTPGHVYQQRQHYDTSHIPDPPPPFNRQRRYNAVRPMPDNRQRGGSRGLRLGRTVNKETGLDKEDMVFADPNLPKLVQEIQDKLMKSSIECMICYDMVRRSANIWSCSSCYSIFHLHCIKKWAQTPTSIDLLADKTQSSSWRCPGCQSVQLTSSKEILYRCFCGKKKDPPSDPYLTPHSCGDPCSKPLEEDFTTDEMAKEYSCPHVCVLQCHPGPCPPCKAFAPPRTCPCGKKKIRTRCSERKSVLNCDKSCDKLLDCGRHRCERTCHVDLCNPCQVPVNASCFCKKTVEFFICGDMNVKEEVKAEDGSFSCNAKCGKKLECCKHFCRDVCHPGPCGHCELLPSRIKTCHCGKTALEEERWSCLDPIPSCSNICSKLLSCGLHNCNETCHAGDCPPCLVQVRQKCHCGSSSRTVECHKTVSDSKKFICTKPCGRKKNCGRHRCSELCCPILNHPKNDDLSADSRLHHCQIPCGKKLSCKQHSCETLCHSGHCPPCLEMIFTDLTCACGKTSVPPPLPCGTPVPNCHLQCSVPQPCGHPATHGCHPCEPCPDERCEFLVTITCSCGRIKATVLCDAGGRRDGDSVFETSKLPVPLQAVESNGKRIPLGQRKLTCDEDCAKLNGA